MARSPTHKFGQIIGDLIEEMVRQPLEEIAAKHKLYLDQKHSRPARNNRKKVAWTDHKGNEHDLDFVLEHNGTEENRGSPKAFIECAWRRYTKHSRNKAQEIQGAVSVLAETYSDYNPFIGVVLAGVFTEGSLQQLRSHGFSIVFCSYETIVEAFQAVGIDAAFDEDSRDSDVLKKVKKYESLTTRQHKILVNRIHALVQSDLDEFTAELEKNLIRRIVRVFVATLHGPICELKTVSEAIEFIKGYDESLPVDGFVRYEVNVRYSNGDHITGQFENKQESIHFLRRIVG